MNNRITPALATALVVLLGCGAAFAESADIHSGWKFVGEVTEVAPDRSLVNGVYWGVSFNDAGEGFAHEMAWNCPATGEIVDGAIALNGLCTMVDPDGDKIFGLWGGEGPVGGRLTGEQTYTAGTGKYEGISGGHVLDCAGITADQLFCRQKVEITLPSAN